MTLWVKNPEKSTQNLTQMLLAKKRKYLYCKFPCTSKYRIKSKAFLNDTYRAKYSNLGNKEMKRSRKERTCA